MEGTEIITLRFPKEDKLHHRSLVEGLFRMGHSFYDFPFRVTWRILSEEELQKNFRHHVPAGIGKLQLMITVPKKKRKLAVDRVLMRRRIREAFRLNRINLKEKVENNSEIRTMSMSLIYIHDKNLPYVVVEEKLKGLLGKLLTRLPIEEI